MHCMTVAYFKFSSVQISDGDADNIPLVDAVGGRPRSLLETLRSMCPLTKQRICSSSIAIIFSIILIVFEALCYVSDIHQDQLIPFYGVRLSYCCVLVIASTIGAVLISSKTPPPENGVKVSCVVDSNVVCCKTAFCM